MFKATIAKGKVIHPANVNRRIDRILAANSDHRCFASIRKTLSTHQAMTVQLTDAQQAIHHLRLFSTREPAHA